MSRRQRTAHAEPITDLGPRIGNALRADVAVLDRPDPDNPNRTVRGASRRAGYDWLHARGVLTDEQREAADRYCVAHERLTGASDRRAATIARRAPWQQGHPAEEQLAAARDIADVHAWIGGRGNREALDGVVIEGRTIESLSAQLSEPVAGVVGRLRAILDIMASQWGID